MKNYGLFDVIGPIMIGPSSSHTAGACRLGRISKIIYARDIKKVIFHLHGIFKNTYQGHGTDRALVGGILGYDTDDERIRDALNIAKNRGIDVSFVPMDLLFAHPNTVKTEFIDPNGESFYVIGSSIGGGAIEITNINGVDVKFGGVYNTIILKYNDRYGMIAQVSTILAENKINIGSLVMNREEGVASAIMEIDGGIDEMAIYRISKLPDMLECMILKPL